MKKVKSLWILFWVLPLLFSFGCKFESESDNHPIAYKASPIEGASNVSVESASMQVNFPIEVNPATVTTNTTVASALSLRVAGACSGSLQLVSDSSGACATLGNPSSDDNIHFTVTVDSTLDYNSKYRIKLTTEIKTPAGDPVFTEPYISAEGFTTERENTPPTAGGGGTISVIGKTHRTVELSWTAATDNVQGALQYKVLRADSADDIDETSDAETNGTLVKDWSVETTADATGLEPDTLYYFNVLVKDLSENKAIYDVTSATTQLDDEDPEPGNSGTINSSGVTANSVTLTWDFATDNADVSGDLYYQIVRSANDDISTDTDATTNGTPVMAWTKITEGSFLVTGLSADTSYYFNVLVKDYSGNMAVYTSIPVTTSAIPDTEAPTPEGDGDLTVSDLTYDSLTLNWTFATDDVDASSSLLYKVVRSLSENINSVDDATSNGIVVANWGGVNGWKTITDASFDVTGLTGSTAHHLNVLVKDLSGNMAVYDGTSATTHAAPDATAPVPGDSGTITSSNETETSLILNWTFADDDPGSGGDISQDLLYRVVWSANDDISTDADANAGTAVTGFNWVTITDSTAAVTGLSAGTTYYFNVQVKDLSNNEALYTTSFSAATIPDTDDPVPGDSGTITSSNKTETSLILNWTFADDDPGSGGDISQDLLYRVVWSVNDDISTDADANAGTAVTGFNWVTITDSTAAVTELTPNTTYYFNVQVKDLSNNEALYTTSFSAATLPDTEAPTPGGSLTTLNASSNSLSLNWNFASDNVDVSGDLFYKVVSSSNDDISNDADAEANGTVVPGFNWTQITEASADVSGLTPSTTYYFNILVRDAADNTSDYGGVSDTTLSP